MMLEPAEITECHCHYHPDLVAVRRGDAGDAAGELGLSEEDVLDSGALCRYLDGLDQSDVEPIIARMAFLRLNDPDLDPHEAAAQLHPLEASPVHGVGFMGHSGYKGDDFAEVAGEEHPNMPKLEESERVIAVVDSGLVPDEDLPSWMRHESVQYDRPQDTEILTHRHPVSHGTFVTSVIRRLAPEHVVSMASARPDPGYMVPGEDPHTPAAAQPTDELNVFGAIVRLVSRHQRTQNVDALNLSLGAHDCPGAGTFLLTMRIALDYWKENISDCAIFAAGGNSSCPKEVYPAAWEDVTAVGALFGGDQPVVWTDGDPRGDLGRAWIDVWAPGHEVKGLGGQSPDQLIEWSGSSFACAVATACSVSGGSPFDTGDGWLSCDGDGDPPEE